jgi:transcriptional regulator GlxA family with amidase domain
VDRGDVSAVVVMHRASPAGRNPTSGRIAILRGFPAILLRMLKNVAVVLGDYRSVFELGVACEVFGVDRTADGLPGFDFAVCSAQPGPVPTTAGFSINVEHGLERLRAADLVIAPAWDTDDLAPAEELLAELRAVVRRGGRVLSLCSGAFLLAAAGLLDGRPATTHWRYAAKLAARYPDVVVDPDVLYVDDGQVITSAGTAAGIDACLHLVRQEYGAAVANAIARRMVVPPHRSGGQAQYVEAPVPVSAESDDLSSLLEWAGARLIDELTVETLAAQALMSPRTFARRFRDVTGTTPYRWLLDQRLLLAEQLLEDTDLGVDEVARRSGLGSADTLRHHFTARRRVGPTAYRRTFRKIAATRAS